MNSQEREGRQYPPISDYAIIGNCRTSALISRDGSIDWLCLPRFDSPSYFAAILDCEKGGRFRIRPKGPFFTDRDYICNTPILETTYQTPTGRAVLRDLFAVATEEEKEVSLTPCHEILRELEGIEGEVVVEILYQPAPLYASHSVVLEDRGGFGLWCHCCGGTVILRSEIPLSLERRGAAAVAVAKVRPGERWRFSLSFSPEAPAVIPPLGEAARSKCERSLKWWRDWEARCSYRGPFRDEVMRSAMVLKLMIYAPSGAIIAAPTSSLPEKIGGIRNWDYRYCWLRDSSFTLRALFDLGYSDDEAAFVDWLLHLTRLTWPKLQVLYDVYGESRLPERELPYLEGYAQTRPVRVGNGAHEQFQLDVYGELIFALVEFAGRGGKFDRDTIRMLNGLGRTVCKRWREPDDGIWEMRTARQHRTHSKALAWVALDRLIALHGMGYDGLSVDQFRSEKEKLREEIESRGYSERLQSYTSTFDGELVDASLLLLPIYGYLDASAPRMKSTYLRLKEKLGHGSLYYRYEKRTQDGLPPGEGTFGICGFWAIECQARSGDVDGAYRNFRELVGPIECQARSGDVDGAYRNFRELVGHANDVGLLSEEIALDGTALGNFPQAFTHIGLINAALALAATERT